MSFASLAAKADAFVLKTMGESVVIDDGTPDGYATSGIFDAAFRLAPMGDLGAESSAPAVTLSGQVVKLCGVVRDTRVRVAGGDWFVVGIHPDRPDGQGMTTLILSEEEGA